MTETIHALFKIRHAPTHAIRDFTFCGRRLIDVSPTFHIGAVSVLVVGSRQKNFANLNGAHVLITGGQNTKGAGDERSSHGRTAVAAILIIALDVGGVAVLAWTRKRPVLGITGLIEVGFELVVVRIRVLVHLTQAGNGDPLGFSFRVEIRIERTMVRVGTVVVTVREDLNDVLALHGIPCRINKALALEFRIGVVVVVLFLEEEVFVFDVFDGREFRTTLVVGHDLAIFINLFQIGAETVVDDFHT